jgi:hypothetical protein
MQRRMEYGVTVHSPSQTYARHGNTPNEAQVIPTSYVPQPGMGLGNWADQEFGVGKAQLICSE